jgi:hypothetical protein
MRVAKSLLQQGVFSQPLSSGTAEKPRPCHCEECGEVMQGVEHDEAILITLSRCRRADCFVVIPPPLSSALTPRNDNSEVFQQFHSIGILKLSWS